MIHDLIIFIFVIVFWCLGFYISTENGMIGYFLREPFEQVKGLKLIGKPIVTCLTCMASIHGIAMFFFLVFIHVIEMNFTVLILGCVMASFIQSFIWQIFDCLRLRYVNLKIKIGNGSKTIS